MQKLCVSVKIVLALGFLQQLAFAAGVPEEDLVKIRSAAPSRPPAKPAKPRKLLIFSRAEGYIHDSIPWGIAALKVLGEKTGAYRAVADDDPAVFDRSRLEQFDAVVFNNNCGNPVPDPVRRKNLLAGIQFALGDLAAPSGASAAEGGFRFDAETRSLRVVTSALEVTIEGGAMTGIRDLRTGEVFSSGATAGELDRATTGGLWGVEAARAKDAAAARSAAPRKPRRSSPVTFQPAGPREGTLVYTGLSGGPAEDELRLALRIEDEGELSFRIEARAKDPQMLAKEVFFPMAGLKPAAVILGSGERLARDDPELTSRAMRIANNIYAPPVAVIEGRRGALGLWPQPGRFGYDDVLVRHTPDHDEVVPQVCLAFGAKDPQTAGEPGVTRGSWWRMAPMATWLDLAKRYRAEFEKSAGARPLWLQSPEWVRKVHAVCTERPGAADPAAVEKSYAELAGRFDPEKLLLFYWNGNCILLFGDHRYMTRFGYPTPAEITALRKHGFRWIGYHPYVLVFSPEGSQRHLEETRRRGFGVPEGFLFRPDYAGPPEAAKFYEHFRPAAAGYYAPLDESKQLWLLHPGARSVREYLARNFGNYCRQHGMSGCYLDILGGDGALHFVENTPADRRIMEGSDWRRGEELACREMKRSNPDLALMSEVQGEWTTAQTFYTWEGETHLTHPQPVRLNHPLRAACWGSYTWTQTDSPEATALLAGLPAVRLADDWSIARARLYMDEELFHDLPERWEPEALAYLRGKNGRWFQYRKMPWGYAYVELAAAGPKVRLGRLVHSSEFPLLQPARIQGWPGYRDRRPIGLSPDREYNFLLEEPRPEDRLWITGLPSGAYLEAVRHAAGHSVIELGASGPARRGQLRVAFHRDCLGVKDGEQERPGPFRAGTAAEFSTTLPGGLVFLWSEPKPADGRFTANFLGSSGHVQANGIPDDRWTPNGGIRRTAPALNGQSSRTSAIELGTGPHRAWTDQWFNLVSGAAPLLRFDVAYPPAEKGQDPAAPLRWSVRVNGSEIWQEEVAPGAERQAREVPLGRFAGRTVLVTLSAEERSATGDRRRRSVHPARFGNLRLVNNPAPETPPEGSRLPRPRRMLLEDSFSGPALSKDWTVHLSPAHGSEGRIAAREGRLVVTGQHYKYEYLSRPFPQEANGVQALVEVSPTGCMTRWNPGLALWWGTDRWLFVSLGDEGVVAELAGHGCRQFPLKPAELPVHQEQFFGWLRVRIAPDKLLVDLSTDGKAWTQKAALPRGPAYAGPPQLLLLGRGTGGKGELFSNDERWSTSPGAGRLGELVVGADFP